MILYSQIYLDIILLGITLQQPDQYMFIFFQKHIQIFFEVCGTRNTFMKTYANHKNGHTLLLKHFLNGLLNEFLSSMRVFIYHKIVTKLKTSYYM